MPVYKIVEIEVKDRETYSKYIEKVPGIISKYGGRYIVRGGKVTPFSGDWNPERLIIMEFDSLETVQKCFNSPEYLEIAPIREQSTNSKAIVVEGVQPSR